MRPGSGGLALASVLVLTGCSATEAPPAAPAGLSVPLAENGHGVLTAQSQAVSAKGKSGDYAATVALTPNWWVGGGEFKVVWYAGLSQTKRFFQISGETGKPADKPAWIANPEVGVREVKVAFDGGLPASVKPTTARAAFPIPAGAKAVTRIEVLYGPADKPLSYLWK